MLNYHLFLSFLHLDSYTKQSCYQNRSRFCTLFHNLSLQHCGIPLVGLPGSQHTEGMLAFPPDSFVFSPHYEYVHHQPWGSLDLPCPLPWHTLLFWPNPLPRALIIGLVSIIPQCSSDHLESEPRRWKWHALCLSFFSCNETLKDCKELVCPDYCSLC